MTEEVSYDPIEKFSNRLIKAKERIDRKLTDKELNNIYFLILYELPYIFCDGKVLAGFIGDKPTKEVSIEGLTDYSLRRQPLNTLHLTERVIKDDRFELIMHKFKYHDVSLRQLNEGHYQITELNAEGINLLDYLGITKEEQNKYTLYKDNILYLFVNDLPNACKLIILFNHRNTLGDETLKEMHEKYFSPFVSSFKDYFDENDKEQLPVPCFMQIKGVKKELKDTLTTASIDEELYTRDYLDKSIDNLNMGIIRCINKKKNVIGDVTAYNEEEGMRSNFLRTMRPDVNYFLILLTASMCKAIFKTVKQNFRYMTDGFFKIYRKYYSELKDKNIKIGRWHDYIYNRELIDFFIREREFELEGLQGEEIVNELKKMTRDIRNFLEGKGELPLFQEDKKNYLKLTLIAKAFIETTPLVAGVAYTVGKKGCPYFCAGWQDEHPFLKTLHKGHRERPLRYPDFIEGFIDKMVLKSDKYHIMIDIPVISNGIFLGTFIIYPQVEDTIESTNKYFENMDEYLPELMDLVDNHRPDLIRSFFLDICANTTRILAGIGKETARQENQIASKDRVIENAEELLRKAHEIPRTYIIDVSGSDFQNKIRRRLASVFLESSAEVKKLIDWLIKLKKLENTGFAFFKAVHGATIELPPLRPRPVTKGRPVLENIYSDKSFASYKLLIIEDWKFIVLQINNKPENNFSQRELNDNNYICQAIETGLTTLKKKHEIIKHGTRAAVAAIMGRNMSHNIGSHVLSYWINKLASDDCATDSRLLFEYLKHRMDFIAEVITNVPAWERSFSFKDGLVEPFKDQFALLDNMAKSEGFCYQVNCKKKYTLAWMNCIRNGSACPRLPVDLNRKKEIGEDISSLEPEPMEIDLKGTVDCSVAIPDGLVGRQAFYSILENFIRNSAKHGGGVIRKQIKAKLGKKSLMFTITAEESKEYEDYIKIIIGDNIGNCNQQIHGSRERVIDRLKRAISNKKEREFIDAEGKIKRGNWGIKEMKLSASFLRGEDISVSKTQTKNEPPLLSVECSDCMKCENKNLNVAFYLRKPKEICIVNDDRLSKNNFENRNHGIYSYGYNEFMKHLETGKTFPHRFLILNSVNSPENIIRKHREQLPLRIFIKNGTSQCSPSNTKERWIAPIYIDIDITKLLSTPRTFILKLYRFLVTEKLGDKQILMNNIQGWQSNGLCESSERSYETCDVSNLIVFDKHWELLKQSLVKSHTSPSPSSPPLKGGEILLPAPLAGEGEGEGALLMNSLVMKNKHDLNCLYYQGISGKDSFGISLSNIPTDMTEKKLILMELIEMAQIGVLIADERIWKNSQAQYRDSGCSSAELLKRMRIELVPIHDETMNIEYQKKILDNHYNNMAIFVIHRGVLEKLTDKTFIEKAKHVFPFVFIDSGRGAPSAWELPQGTRYVPISAIESSLSDLDKHSVVQTLFSVRRAKNE